MSKTGGNNEPMKFVSKFGTAASAGSDGGSANESSNVPAPPASVGGASECSDRRSRSRSKDRSRSRSPRRRSRSRDRDSRRRSRSTDRERRRSRSPRNDRRRSPTPEPATGPVGPRVVSATPAASSLLNPLVRPDIMEAAAQANPVPQPSLIDLIDLSDDDEDLRKAIREAREKLRLAGSASHPIDLSEGEEDGMEVDREQRVVIQAGKKKQRKEEDDDDGMSMDSFEYERNGDFEAKLKVGDGDSNWQKLGKVGGFLWNVRGIKKNEESLTMLLSVDGADNDRWSYDVDISAAVVSSKSKSINLVLLPNKENEAYPTEHCWIETCAWSEVIHKECYDTKDNSITVSIKIHLANSSGANPSHSKECNGREFTLNKLIDE